MKTIFLGLVLYGTGIILIGEYSSYWVSLGVFLVLWGSNLESETKFGK